MRFLQFLSALCAMLLVSIAGATPLRAAPAGSPPGPVRGATPLYASPAAASARAPAPVPQEGDAPADTVEKEDEDDEKGLPLEPARTLSFTASEGSWISLDVSPDGETIVFELLGDLYTLPIEGGQATRLTEGMPFDTQPRFGPDGERIAFISDRSGAENVWVISRDGADTVQISEEEHSRFHSPEWTPDGDYIVVSRSAWLDPAKLWMYHVAGGTGVPLVDGEENEQLRMSGAAFGDDPRYIWYAMREGTWEYNAVLPEYQLEIYDRETGERYTRTSRYGSAFRPTLSPDGRWLVYGTRYDRYTGLRIRDLETGDERWLAYPVQHDDQESVATRDVYPGMSFMPDSRALVATYGGRMWRIPVDGSPPEQIPFTADVELGLGPELDFEYAVEDAPTFLAQQIRDAVPSPDGSRLAFAALDRLYVTDYPDGEPRRLTEAENVIEAEPVWSPDGRWIAFVAWSPSGGHIWRVRSDGSGEPRRLTRVPAVYQQPAWSPDGERIVAIRGAARTYLESTGPFAPGSADDLIWIPASGGEAALIAPAEGRTHPHFVPADTGRIYLYSDEEDEEALISIRYDGTDEKEHLKVTGATLPGEDEPMDADLVIMGPEGERAIAAVVNDLYVIAVPYVGGDVPAVSVANPDDAPVPVFKLTRVGGQFPAWGPRGETVHWSIGNAHFVYDLAEAQAARDSAEAAERRQEMEGADEEDGDEEDGGEGARDQEAQEGEGGEEDDEPVYEPEVTRIEIPIRRDIPEGTVALRGARVITMRGDEVLRGADIVIEDNRIRAVGARGEVEIPDGADVIDVSGTTIIPGFVDTHAHLRPAWGIHKTQVWQYLANLAYGVTTTRDPQTGTTDVLTYSDRVKAGQMPGPRIYSTGPGVFRSERVEDLDDARDILRRYSEYYDTKTIKMYLAGNRQQRQWIIMAAREQELMPTTEGALDLKLDLTQIIDGYPGHEHSFPIFPLYEDVVRLVAESGVTYTPTFLVTYGGPWAENYYYVYANPHDDEKLNRFMPHQAIDRRTRRRNPGPGDAGWFMPEEHVFDDEAEVLAEIVEAGGQAGVGSHGQLQGLGYHWELWSVASGGLANHDVLRAATIMGAEAIGLENDLGSIEPGKLADLLVLEENPLEDLHNSLSIRFVMKNGRLYEGATLNEVWPRQRPLPQPYWLEEGAPDPAAGLRQAELEGPAGLPLDIPRESAALQDRMRR